MPSVTSHPWRLGLLFLCAGLAVYSASFFHEFVWDDFGQVIQNEAYHNPFDLKTHFLDPSVTGGNQDAQIYRPVRNILFSIQWLCFRENALWYHVWNALLHAMNAFLWVWVFQRIFSISLRWSCVGGLIFLVHPLVTEVVCWAKGGEDLYATLFGLLCLLAWHGFRQTSSARHLTGSILCLGLAVFSKESALFLPLIMLSDRRLYLDLKGRLLAYAAAGLALIFLMLRYSVLNQVGQVDYLGGDLWQTQLGMAHIYSDLLYKFILPVDLQVNFMGMDPFHQGVGRLWLLWLGLLAFLGVMIRSIGLKPVFMLSVSFLPVANVIPMMQWGAERFVYLPLGFLIACVLLMIQKSGLRLQRPLGVIVLVWCVGLVVLNFIRQPVWKNNFTLGMEMLRKNPYSYHGLYLALEYDKTKGHFSRLENMSREYLSLYPNEERLYHYHAFALIAHGQSAKAMSIIEAGLSVFPRSQPLIEWKHFLQSKTAEVQSS